MAAVLAVVLASCGTGKDKPAGEIAQLEDAAPSVERMPVVKLPDLVGKRKPVFLSELAESITYIPLETTNEFLIGNKSVQVKPSGDYLFVSEHGKPVGQFDRSGKFIRKIGVIGRGPGEYNFDFTFWPDHEAKRVYVWNADRGTIMAFSFEGHYLGDIVPEIKPMAFIPLGSGRFLTWDFGQKEVDGKFFRLLFHDSTGKTINRVFEPKMHYDFSRGIAIMTPLMTPAPVGVLYNTFENDTLYRATADGRFEPAFSWDPGKLRMTLDWKKDYQGYLRERDNCVMDFNAFEGHAFWYLGYAYKGTHAMGLYDKASGESWVVANPDTAQKGVYNDIDGGPSFFPGWDNEKGRYFVRLIDAIDLMDYLKNQVNRAVPVKDAEASRRYREMVASLNENSNPVVMLVEVK